ncbi:glycosyltransferase family 1 protein [Bacillus sp. ISL-46]|uniref:glycosyltransferase family 4 protein n=1 Tax=Bacillus sp. ISL-46 TaxID=2819129 RepID=UPI001BE557DD|nr:glycosyltransferase family 1 protein [Bacillus sp. ISL-46]MBT2724004.1 glycosyltransferase family 4 protein [Bacillus sp. ISL-46]
MINIGVDAHILSGKFQGSRTYLANLYENILIQDKVNTYNFLGFWEDGKPFEGNSSYITYKSDSRIKRLAYQSYGLLKEREIDILHSQYISPIFLPCKSVITIHDILFETHPEYFTKSEVIRNKILVRYSAKRANQIHTVSNYSKNKLIEIYGIEENKIKIVPNGVNYNLFNNVNIEQAKKVIKEKFGVENYILTVGRIEPRKNHINLLKAMKIVKKFEKQTPPLVIVGRPDFGFDKFYKELNEFELNKDVFILDSIDDKFLPLIYKAAKVFVYPSFAEGFGIPPLEAMASGVPVITSNLTAIPEVVGNAGLLVNPLEPNEIAKAIRSILNNQDMADSLSNKGITQSKKWSWESSAKSYLESISELLY